MSEEPQNIRKLLNELRKREKRLFPQVNQKLDAPDKHGAYIIHSPKNVVLHVGRTLRGQKGLKQRLNNHLNGASSFTRQFLRGKGSVLRQGYRFSFLEIDDARTRALVEALAVGSLCPKHLGVGENVR